MLDVEAQVQRVWNPDVRPLVAEAWRCYVNGAIRASISMTWVAVCADLTAKVVRLAEDGDSDAKTFQQSLETAQRAGLTADGIRAMQDIERSLISTAVKLELIDTISERELERLREDRHLCVHPSLRGSGGGGVAYDPRPEVARAHLAAAIDTLLTHPPTQGRRLVEAFATQVADPLFVSSEAHLLATFFAPVRATTRRNIVGLAAKHALLELPGPGGITDEELARRMGIALETFAKRDRRAVADALAPLQARFRVLDGGKLLRAATRLGELDEFWDIVDDPLADQLDGLIATLSPAEWQQWPIPEGAGVLALVRVDRARQRLPSLQPQFDRLGRPHKGEVMAYRPHPFFAPHVPGLLRDALSFRHAESETESAVLPHGPFLNQDLLARTLTEWAGNVQCRIASRMPQLAVALYRATAHLHPADTPIWQQFLTSVRAAAAGEPTESYYRYDEVEAAMTATPPGPPI